jgi:PAS domain S-box-containing protein
VVLTHPGPAATPWSAVCSKPHRKMVAGATPMALTSSRCASNESRTRRVPIAWHNWCFDTGQMVADSPNLLRHRRRGLLLASGLITPLYLLDALLGRASRASLTFETAWLAVLFAAALFQRPARRGLADLTARFAGLATGVLFSLLVGVTGGSASPYFYYSLAIPWSALVLLPDLPSVAGLASIGTLGGGIATLIREGHGWKYVAAWSYLGLAASLLTGVGAWVYFRMAHAEARSARIRADGEQRRAADVAAAHAEATRSRDNLRKILENMPDMVVVSRLDGSIAFANGRGQELFGIAPGSPISTTSVADRVVAEDRPILARRREALAAGLDPGPGQVRVLSARGTLECEINGLHLDFDGAPAIVTVVRDVTERREMDRRLALADRMASIGTLAAGVAHEINNPLSYVLSNLRFLSGELAAERARNPGPDGEALVAVREALEGAERVRRIVRDLKEFTRPSDEQGPVDIEQVFDRAATLAANEIRFRARLEKDYGKVPPVRGDEARLLQVALNLLMNAAQAIPEGRPDDNEITVRTRSDALRRVLIEIRDTGCGMEPDVCRHVFEPFFTTKPVGVGTGLGLSICHGIVHSLGGDIAVESAPGQGSVFRISLPAEEAAPAARTVKTAPAFQP